MDHRTSLQLNQVLELGGLECHVGRLLGRGANALVYEAWYPDTLNPEQKHAVLLKELYPYHPQGRIYRREDGGLEIYPDAEDFYAFHRRNFQIGNEIHLRLLYDHPDIMGANLNSFPANNTVYSLLGYTGGRSLQEEAAAAPGDLRLCVQRMQGILDALDAFHKSGYLHLDISPDNIMLVGRGSRERVFLIDYNSAHPLSGDSGEPLSCKPGYSSPEVETGMAEELTCASDLYSVAAVFFRCLMGRSMMLEERLRSRAPDGSDSPLLEGAPQTVSSLVRQILRKGLDILPRRRYQTVDQMKRVFQELQDRIDCIGVTHWALWESGRRSLEQLIGANPSLHYVREEAGLYPIRVRRGEKLLTLTEYLEELTGPEGRSGLVLAQGGMGKTTLLLHTALQKGRKYTGSAPAVVYLSLGGWVSGQRDYIRRQILLNLRFKPDMTTYNSALHTLEQLLQKPLTTRRGEHPVVLLLLDGLNEISGDPAVLVEEINALGALPGVRILGASRSELPQLALEPVALTELMVEDVEQVLGQRGLLIPESRKMFDLLRTPLILSIFLKTSPEGKQLPVENEAQLMSAYLDSLFEKEKKSLPAGSPELWQMEAALRYVLPCIAAREGTLNETELLKIVRECRNTVKSRAMLRAFPDWIGHSRDILGDTENPEQWLGLICHKILWRRLGLLIRDEQGQYRIFHQNVAEYLRAEGVALRRRVRRLRWFRSGSVTVLAAVLLSGALLVGMPRSYDDRQTEAVLDKLSICYSAFAEQGSQTEQLLARAEAGDPAAFLALYDRFDGGEDLMDTLAANQDHYRSSVEKLVASGDRVSWSGEPMDGAAAAALIQEAQNAGEDYRRYEEALRSWTLSERIQGAVPDFPAQLERLLDTDARLFSKLYYESCGVHLEKADPFLREKLEKSLPDFRYAGAEPEENLTALRNTRSAAYAEAAGAMKTIALFSASAGQEPPPDRK